MNCRALLSLLTLFSFFATRSDAADIRPDDGFAARRFLAYPGVKAFTWDDQEKLWIASANSGEVTISQIGSDPSQLQPLRSLPRVGNGRASILVTAKRVFLADGGVIRTFHMEHKSDVASHVPPSRLFPDHLQITSLAWAPLGPIYFLYESTASQESGLGRFNLRNGEWDVVAKGKFSNIAFDENGMAITTSENYSLRVAPGLDYQRGLETYQIADLALKPKGDGPKASFASVYGGVAWAREARGAWMIFDSKTSELNLFKEENGGLKRQGQMARLTGGSTLHDLQIGPDGNAWLLIGANQSGDDKMTAIYQLQSKASPAPARESRDLAALNAKELALELGNPNAWHRDAALRILENRDDLRSTRGLHPSTPLHDTRSAMTNSPMMRVYAALAMQRLGLLDEGGIEEMADDTNAIVRVWAGHLIGERNYPTEVAFHKLMKLAKETNLVVRGASAVGARQFVSGSLAVDTPPRAMPLREVFTGGILSTLWFNTEKGSSPETHLLFWNAVRPITAYDPVHPIGFFNGDNDSKLEIAEWIVPLITRQIAEVDDPKLQEEAMVMVGELKPSNVRIILGALRGLKSGSDMRRVVPSARSLQVLADFAKSSNKEIASLADEIRRRWEMPFR